MKCPSCGNSNSALIWSDSISWGCLDCGFYEDEYHGPSVTTARFGIRSVEGDLVPNKSSTMTYTQRRAASRRNLPKA